MYDSDHVGVQLLQSWEDDSGRVDAAHLFHSPGREDRIPHRTKVLHVANDDLHVIGIESELGKRSLGRLL